MKMDWLMHVCIVLTVGVGLVSCTKEEINQAMNRPAEILQSSRPCTPAGVSSTSAPEFCVNLMEIQLLNQDTAVDVSLTLVNRTDRRIQIGLKGAYLTDSSGQTWAKSRSSGLGSTDSSSAASIDPNVENQGSILFHKSNAQSSADLTFSLRGEIVIWRVDSRGQPIFKTPFAAQRAVNISGIRIPQKPLQSSGSTSQNPGTELTKLSPLSAELVAPNDPSPSGAISAAEDAEPIAIDVVGLRLGMSPVEVEKVFKQRHLDNGILPSPPTNVNPPLGKALKIFTFLDIATGQVITVKDSKYVSTMSGFYDAAPYGAQREQITAQFSPLHNKEQLVMVSRHQNYNAGSQPATDTFLKSLQEKYGSIPAKSGCDINGSDCNYIWHYRQDGTPIRNISSECIEHGKRAGSSIYGVSDMENQSNKCGSILVKARMSGRNGLVNSVVIIAHNVELDFSTHKVANAIVAAAEKERTDRQMQKARTQKPDF